MSSNYGNNLKLTIFGQSHGAGIGMVLDGIPAGKHVDMDALQVFLSRRAPGRNSWSTARNEGDFPEFLGGLVNGYTCGAPIAAVIRNNDIRESDYSDLMNRPRPGHADYTAQIKYSGYQDASGGGHFSGRLTAPLCIAGGMCLQWLHALGIEVRAHIFRIADVPDEPFDPIAPQITALNSAFPTLSISAGEDMKARILKARQSGDSLGGTIECAITGLPAGVGEPMFDNIESRLSQILFGIPAVKGVDFGSFETPFLHHGSEYNDPFTLRDGNVCTLTNHAGGILGGISNGMPVLFRVRIKPTPSISQPQQTVDLATGTNTVITVNGRHDPCIVPRAVCVVEAAAAVAIYDLILGNHMAERK